jgi:hypothetical protein
MRVTNGILIGCALLLPVNTVICVQTLKANYTARLVVEALAALDEEFPNRIIGTQLLHGVTHVRAFFGRYLHSRMPLARMFA